MGFLDIRIEKTERAIKQAFMELRREKPVEKIRVKELCDRACINKSTFYAHYQDIYALANAMEDEMVHAVVESLPRLTASDVSERTEWLAREMFRAFTAHQAEISVLFSGSRQGLFINRVEQAMCQCIAQTDPTFETDVVEYPLLKRSFFSLFSMSGTAGNPFCLYLSKTFIVRMFFADNQSRRYSAARHRASAFASPRSPRDGTAANEDLPSAYSMLRTISR